MKKTLTISLFILYFSFINAQVVNVSVLPGENGIAEMPKLDTLDVCLLRAQYRMTSVKDVNIPDKKTNHFMLLQIGKKISKFSDFFILKSDSVEVRLVKQNKSNQEIMNAMLPYFTGSSSLIIFKNYPSNQISTIDRAYLTGTFLYTENTPEFDWKMQAGAATICGYSCKKATTSFRGRNYTAWYAPKIALSDGPWKFRGLPGLILKVTDEKNEYSFECVAIEKSKNNEAIYYKDRDYFKTNRVQFNKTMKRAHEEPSVELENMGIKPKSNKRRPYNPIELE